MADPVHYIEDHWIWFAPGSALVIILCCLFCFCSPRLAARGGGAAPAGRAAGAAPKGQAARPRRQGPRDEPARRACGIMLRASQWADVGGGGGTVASTGHSLTKVGRGRRREGP